MLAGFLGKVAFLGLRSRRLDHEGARKVYKVYIRVIEAAEPPAGDVTALWNQYRDSCSKLPSKTVPRSVGEMYRLVGGGGFKQSKTII